MNVDSPYNSMRIVEVSGPLSPELDEWLHPWRKPPPATVVITPKDPFPCPVCEQVATSVTAAGSARSYDLQYEDELASVTLDATRLRYDPCGHETMPPWIPGMTVLPYSGVAVEPED